MEEQEEEEDDITIPVKERFHLGADGGAVVAKDDAQNDQGQHTRHVQRLFRYA